MNNPLNLLLDYEEQLIIQAIRKKFDRLNEIVPFTSIDFDIINANLLLTSNDNVAFNVHNRLINILISRYLTERFPDQITSLEKVFVFEESKEEEFYFLPIHSIPQLIEDLHFTFLNSKFYVVDGQLKRSKSKHYLKEIGAVYTERQITYEIVRTTIANATESTEVRQLNCLDFACGTGRFYFEAVKILREDYNLPLDDIICNRLYAVDIDNTALSVLKCKILALFNKLNQKVIDALDTNVLWRNALIPNSALISNFENTIDLTEDFKVVQGKEGFDAIFSNPPYYLLKVNKTTNPLLQEYFDVLQMKVKNEIGFFKTSGFYSLSIEGMLNYFKLSIEMILRLTKPNGQIGIICPSTIFADISSTKIRKHLLSQNKIHFIRYYSESANLFDNVAQSTVIFFLQKSSITDQIEVEYEGSKFKVDYPTIKKVFSTNHEIPLIDQTGWEILKKLSEQPKLKDYDFLFNKRGELDLTLFKGCITNDPCSEYRLVRGNMITEKGIVQKKYEFVDIEMFLTKKSKDFLSNDFNKPRLICQQVSNIDSIKRLKFTFSGSNDILANSCNYINSKRNFDDLRKLRYILNSELLNWRFKVTSSNNHINNYEIDELPVIDLDSISLSDFSDDYYDDNILICRLYGLNDTETDYILKDLRHKKETLEVLENEEAI